MANRTHGTGSLTQRSEGTWSLRYYAPGEDGKYRQVRETVKGLLTVTIVESITLQLFESLTVT